MSWPARSERSTRTWNHGSGEPVFEDEKGPCWGGVLFLSDAEAPRSADIKLAPGVYDLIAVLRSELRQYSMSSDTNLWSTSRTIEVVSGRDVVIEMGW